MNPDKRTLHHYWRSWRKVHSWYFLIIAIALAAISIGAHRSNNLRMIELREKVAQADKENGDTEGALRELREFVHSHMNTDLASGENAIRPPIQLKYRYERLVAAEKDRVAKVNEKIYTNAQAYCERLYPGSFSGGPRVPCIEDYVAENGTREQTIPDALYKYDFVSPGWSPDLAGFTKLFAIFFAVIFLVWHGIERWVRSELRE